MAVVKYVGRVSFAGGIWLGLELKHPRSAIGLTVPISAKETLPIVKHGLTGMNQSGQIVLKCFANVNVNRWL